MEYTRAQRMANECTHDEFWRQFVTPGILRMVKQRFEKVNYKAELHVWDSYTDVTKDMIDLAKWRRLMCPQYEGTNKYAWSLSDNVCILKAAADMLMEEKV